MIPAANINGVDLKVIGQKHAAVATEIARLAAGPNSVDQTSDEFRRLCQLLFEVG